MVVPCLLSHVPYTVSFRMPNIKVWIRQRTRNYISKLLFYKKLILWISQNGLHNGSKSFLTEHICFINLHFTELFWKILKNFNKYLVKTQEQRHINEASELILPNCMLLCTSAESKFTDYLAGCKTYFFQVWRMKMMTTKT